jgi:hypothetical protein
LTAAKRGVSILLLIALLGSHLPMVAQEGGGSDRGGENSETVTPPAPYGIGLEPEVSPFLRDLRRFEIIAFGTLPFTLFFTNVGYDVGRYGYYGFTEGFGSDITRQYRPLLFGDRGYDNDEKTGILLTAVGVSMILATVDLLIESNRRNRADEP